MSATVIHFPHPGFVERLVRAIDDQLPKMCDDATRLKALKAAEYQWTLRYCTFRRNIASGRYDESGGPTAFDYAIAIAEISVRRTKLEMKLRGQP